MTTKGIQRNSSFSAPSQAMLMAAGCGMRLLPFTQTCPKAFMPLMGVPMAQYAVDSLVSAGVKNIVVNLHHLAEKALDELQNIDAAKTILSVSDEKKVLLGSAGGIAKGFSQMDYNAFYLVNADVISDLDLRGLAQHHHQLRMDKDIHLTLTVFPPDGSQGSYRGIAYNEKTSLMTDLDQTPQKNVPFFMGSAIIEPEALLGVSEFEPSEFIPKILLPALMENRVGVYPSRGLWLDVGSPELWYQAHLRLIRDLESNTLLERIKKRIEENGVLISKQAWISRERNQPDQEQNRVVAHLSGPSYLSLKGGVPSLGSAYPFGPSAFYYGLRSELDFLSRSQNLSLGIGMGQDWINLS